VGVRKFGYRGVSYLSSCGIIELNKISREQINVDRY